MIIVHFVLDLYLAAVLGVAGLAKIKDPALFATTLRRHRILPSWSVASVSHVLPWVESVLAGALVAGLAPMLTSALALALFMGFFLVETVLLATGRASGCGCYSSRAQKVDGAALVTSAALVCLAALHLAAARGQTQAPWAWRLPAVVLLGGAGCWLLWRAVRWRRAQRFQGRSMGSDSSDQSYAPLSMR